MILLISAQEPQLAGPVDHRFGRSLWLVKVDTGTNQWEAFSNPGASQSGGAGVAAAQFVIDQKANVVISGDFGPHAATAFRQANISMYLLTDEISTVKQAVDNFKEEKLTLLK